MLLTPPSAAIGPARSVLAIGLAVAAGGAAAILGPAPAIGLAVALPVTVALLLDVRAGLVVVVGLIALLPYATVPVRVVITPTFLSLVTLATILVWAVRWALSRDTPLRRTSLDLPLLLMLAAGVFAFITGLDRGYTTQTAHDFGKLIAGILLTVVAINIMTPRLAAVLAGVVVGASAVSAALGLALYVLGPSVIEQVLSRLVPLGYPSQRIARWLEDDPTKALRLTSTGVDPNSYGGLLMVALVLAVGLAVARKAPVPRWLTLPAVPLLALALLLTYSRGAWLGAAVGIGWLAVVRYRWLLPLMAAGAVAVLLTGAGAGFTGRLVEGFLLQDPATRLRLAEYQNALTIIRTYPVFGVGFGQAPSIDLQTGVSSIYLTVASRMGLVGLAAFLWAVGVVLVVGWREVRRRWDTADGALLLALLAGLVSALAAGGLDHYFFNIEFSHMATLFWLLAGATVGMAVAPAPVAMTAHDGDGPGPRPAAPGRTYDWRP